MERIIKLLEEQNELMREQNRLIAECQKQLANERRNNRKSFENYKAKYGATVQTPDRRYV